MPDLVKLEGEMKPWFGVFIFLVMLLVVPWSRLEVTISAMLDTALIVIGTGCILAVVVIFIEITIRGLRSAT